MSFTNVYFLLFALILCRSQNLTSIQKRHIIKKILDASHVNNSLAGDIVCNDTINDDSINQLKSIYNVSYSQFKAESICDRLEINSMECYNACLYYKNPLNMLDILGPNVVNISQEQISQILYLIRMSGGPFNFYNNVDNPDMCLYNHGTYCYIPAKRKGNTLAETGCCVPGECKGDDAIKILNIYPCFRSFYYMYGGIDLEPTCEIPEREYNAGFWVVTVIFIVFAVCVISATVYKQYLIEYKQETESNGIVSIFNIQDTYKHFIGLRSNTSMNFLDGLRVWSMFWVIFGHGTHNFIAHGGLVNLQTLMPSPIGYSFMKFRTDYDYVGNKWYMQIILQSFFSVDTFFWLSGSLGAFSILRYINYIYTCTDSY